MAESTELTKMPMASGGGVSAIVPQDIDQVWRLATLVSSAGMAPKGMEKPEQIAVALMHGLEVGFTPMAALQSIAVINGRPTIWGDGALGLVRASGKMEWIKEWVEGTGDNRVACCNTKRKGEPESAVYKFSVDQAKKAGLWTKTGPWTLYPERMLMVRPRSWALRDVYADVLRGLSIKEEVEDTDHQIKDVTPPSPPVPPKPNEAIQSPPVPPSSSPEPVIASQTESAQGRPSADYGVNTVDSNEITDIDPETGEVIDAGSPSDFFYELETALMAATSIAGIAIAWDKSGVDEKFSSSPGDMDTALAIKARAVKKVKEAAST